MTAPLAVQCGQTARKFEIDGGSWIRCSWPSRFVVSDYSRCQRIGSLPHSLVIQTAYLSGTALAAFPVEKCIRALGRFEYL